MNDLKSVKLGRNEARKLIARILNNNPTGVLFSRHALHELKADRLTTVDVFNVLKSPAAKILDEPEYENGSFRYRIGTSNIMVVVSFVTKKQLVVVTTWRKK